MGVSNVYNQAKANAIAAIKNNMAAQSTKKTADAKPSYMKMTGSIFNAPGVNNQASITDLNTVKSLAELNLKPQIQPDKNNPDNGNQPGMPSNAGEGRAAASSLDAQTKELKSKTTTVEQDADVVNDYSKSSQKLDKEIAKNDKKFNKTLKQQQSELKKDNKKLDKLNKETLEIEKEVNNAQHELDSLLARNSFSMGGSESNSSSNQSKINELQTFIGSKVSVMQANGKQIYSLQRSQSKTLSKMKKTNTQYIKTQHKNTKAIEQQQTKTEKVIEFATKAEAISQMVQTGGQTLKMLGNLMVLAATTPWTAWMRPVGMVMQKVGTVAEVAGQYGIAAANITKTAAYAADGNLMGAMQSAAAAVQSGNAAVKSTKNIKTEFGSINQQGKEATAKLEARKEVSQQKTNSLQELNKGADGKPLIDTKDITNGDNITDRKEFERRLKAAGVTDEQIKNTKANAFGTDTNGNRVTAKTARKATAAQMISSGKDAKAAFTETKETGFKNVASNTAKKSTTNITDNMNKISKGFTSLASMYGMVSGNGSMSGGNVMGDYNNGYMTNGIKQTQMTDQQKRTAWRQRNANALNKKSKVRKS